MQYKRTKYISLFEGKCRQSDVDGKEIKVSISGIQVNVKLATSDTTKYTGMMHSSEPSGNNGMMFVYDSDEIRRFWMKNVKYPLDIVFFNSKMEMVDHFTMKAYNGESDNDLKIYKSSKPATFAIELPSGWCKHNLKPNCRLTI